MNHESSRLRAIAGMLPTVAVLLILGSTAYWGHATGWSISSPLIGNTSSAPSDEDWCEAHGVPDTGCIACHPELAGADPNDWCREHGVPESKCSICHPEILSGDHAADWCAEHGVPESQCTLCRPEAIKAEFARSGELDPLKSDISVSLDPKAKPGKDPATCQTHAILVQFASAASIEKAGIELELVQKRPVSEFVRATGNLAYDQTRLARLSSRAAGVVWRVDALMGQSVTKGEVLALVDSIEVGRAKAELMKAVAGVVLGEGVLARTRASEREGFRTNAELQVAVAELRDAEIRLLAARQLLGNLGLTVTGNGLRDLSLKDLARRIQFLGLPASVVKSLGTELAVATLIPIKASLDGTVVSRQVVIGEMADTSRVMFTVANLGKVWAMLDVRQEDAARVRLGQPMTFRMDGDTNSLVTGKISWVDSAVDGRARTLKVRAEILNPSGTLRANTFGTARIKVRSAPEAIAVSRNAIHWEGCCHVVFVQETETVFRTRKVILGTRSGPMTEIVVGLLAGERVATTGSHVLKSALLKSRLGAGCVDD